MIHRRTFLSVAALLLSTTVSCLYFRPIDPNPSRARTPDSSPLPADRPAPTPEPAAQPVIQPPVQPPVQRPVQPPAQPEARAAQPVVQPESRAAQPAPKPEERAAQPVAQRAAPPAATGRRGAISDANVAAMVLASNNTDISYARLVPTRAQRDDVTKFAERMLTDHTGVNGLVIDLLRKLDLGAEDNVMSLDMRDVSANNRDILRELSGFAFDSTYMENEVSYHQKFLASIDNDMLPNARNGELRNLLVAIRPAVAAHLAHAEQIRANVLAKK